MRIFGRGAHILSILGYMSGEYLNGMELSLISHWHEYVRRAMKGMKTPVARGGVRGGREGALAPPDLPKIFFFLCV